MLHEASLHGFRDILLQMLDQRPIDYRRMRVLSLTLQAGIVITVE